MADPVRPDDLPTLQPERWRRVEEVFHQAIERPAGDRRRFLNEACRGDATLRKEVESLVDSHVSSEGFLENPVAEEALRLMESRPADPMIGRIVGPYRLIREIGRGGMGAVYLATRADEEYRKQVAIKLIKPGSMSEFTLKRFHIERQILATLDHINIARLLDGGTTSDGIPYIVMEYVEGIPIDAYSDAHRLATTDRLRLFREVCSAVHYAHQNLIIHRDVKHGNILVTADGVPKLLDFGIAKLLGPESEFQTVAVTAEGMRLMTLEYASPEQVRGETLTTASDIYALGVLLYKLLTGRHPFRYANAFELAHAIEEIEPERPSTAVVRVGAGSAAQEMRIVEQPAETVSSTRDGTPQRLQRRLRGDLDMIVLKALRKEPARRYATVEQFSEDIRRHLEGLPVIAHGDTVAYRATKFVRRHAVGVTAAGLLLLTLLAGILATAWQARIASAERDRARMAAQKAEQINAFLQQILQSANPWASGKDVTVAQILQDAARRVDTELRDQPEIQSNVRTTIGLTYYGLGMYADAEPQLRQALATRLRLFGVENGDVAISQNNLGMVLFEMGDLNSAETLFRKALPLARRTLGAETPVVASITSNLAKVLRRQGDDREAERLQREVLVLQRKLFGPQSLEVAQGLNDLAVLLGTRGDHASAERLHRQSLAIVRSVRGNEHPDVASGLSNLAGALVSLKQYDAAKPLFEEALSLRRKLLGNDHPDVSFVLYNYAYAMREKGDFRKAEDLARQVLAMRGRSIPDSYPTVAASLIVLGRSYVGEGRCTEAEAPLREALRLRVDMLPPGHWLIANNESVLGEALACAGRRAEAEALLRGGYERLRAALGEDHELTREAAQRIEAL